MIWYRIVLYHIVSYYIVPYRIVLRHVELCHVIPYCIVPHYVIVYRTYCTRSCYCILYCIVPQRVVYCTENTVLYQLIFITYVLNIFSGKTETKTIVYEHILHKTETKTSLCSKQGEPPFTIAQLSALLLSPTTTTSPPFITSLQNRGFRGYGEYSSSLLLHPSSSSSSSSYMYE